MDVSSTTQRGMLSSTAAKAAVAIAVVAVGGIAAAQVGLLAPVLGDGTDAVTQVPDGVDSIGSVDPGVLENDVSNELYVTAYNATVGEQTGGDARRQTAEVPENLTAATDLVENETGLDPRAAEQVVFFQKQRQNFSQPQYSGVVVHADWTESAVVAAVSNGTDTEYVNESIEGVTVYRPADDERDDDGIESIGSPDSETWVAVLDDGEYVFGTERAVNDTVQVAVGNADALDGDLLSAYEDTEDGYFRYAQRSQNVNVSELNRTMGSSTGLNVTAYATAYNDLHVTAGSYYVTGDGDLGYQSRVLTNSTDTARDVESLIQGFVSVNAGAIQNETVENELRSTEVSREDTTVTVTREMSVETAKEILRWYGSLYDGMGGAPGLGTQPIA